MLGPHFADLGRSLLNGLSLLGLLELQAKGGQCLVESGFLLITRRAVILKAQGVAGDGNQFFAGPLT